MVEVAESSGRWVVAHATTPESMRRSVEAGIRTIEHGDGGTREVFRLMASRDVALCPTAGGGSGRRHVWRMAKRGGSGSGPGAPEEGELPAGAGGGGAHLLRRRRGVFDHGDNVWELELMVEYGMPVMDALRTATSGNAEDPGAG